MKKIVSLLLLSFTFIPLCTLAESHTPLNAQNSENNCQYVISVKTKNTQAESLPLIKNLGGDCKDHIKVKIESDVTNLLASIRLIDGRYKINVLDEKSRKTFSYSLSQLELQILIAAMVGSMGASQN